MSTLPLDKIREAWERNEPSDVSFVWNCVEDLLDEIDHLNFYLKYYENTSPEHLFSAGKAVRNGQIINWLKKFTFDSDEAISKSAERFIHLLEAGACVDEQGDIK